MSPINLIEISDRRIIKLEKRICMYEFNNSSPTNTKNIKATKRALKKEIEFNKYLKDKDPDCQAKKRCEDLGILFQKIIMDASPEASMYAKNLPTIFKMAQIFMKNT